MNHEAIKLQFPDGFPLVTPGFIHDFPNPIVQTYLSCWKDGKISLEAAYCGIIHCLMKHVNGLEELVHEISPKEAPELKLVEIDEEKSELQKETSKDEPVTKDETIIP